MFTVTIGTVAAAVAVVTIIITVEVPMGQPTTDKVGTNSATTCLSKVFPRLRKNSVALLASDVLALITQQDQTVLPLPATLDPAVQAVVISAVPVTVSIHQNHPPPPKNLAQAVEGHQLAQEAVEWENNL